jgi:hypothetical protein
VITSKTLVRTSPFASLLLIAACSPEAPEPTNTVSYYREHPEERKAMMARCSDDPGGMGQTANCINAKQATATEDIGSFKDLPPMNLGGKKKESAGTAEGSTGDEKPREP